LFAVVPPPAPPPPQHSTIIDVTPGGTVKVPVDVKVWLCAIDKSMAQIRAKARADNFL
jgi:hypothetical protein